MASVLFHDFSAPYVSPQEISLDFSGKPVPWCVHEIKTNTCISSSLTKGSTGGKHLVGQSNFLMAVQITVRLCKARNDCFWCLWCGFSSQCLQKKTSPVDVQKCIGLAPSSLLGEQWCFCFGLVLFSPLSESFIIIIFKIIMQYYYNIITITLQYLKREKERNL